MNMGSCMFHMIVVWCKYDMGARNVLLGMCGWGVKGCFWVREFRLPAWPRFLFILSSPGNLLECLFVCVRVYCMNLCKWTRSLFSQQRRHCPVLGRPSWMSLTVVMYVHAYSMWTNCTYVHEAHGNLWFVRLQTATCVNTCRSIS